MGDYMELSKINYNEREELLLLLTQRKKYLRYNQCELFEPYEFQKKFYNASKKHQRRFLCAANRVGKSFSESMEISFHLTGKYPTWYDGHKFKRPILAWAVGITGDSTRKVLQKELFGTSMGKDKEEIGTGSIPRKYIDLEHLEKDGHRILNCKIKHHDANGNPDGWSMVEFRSTQQGEHVLMGATVDYIWLDEEDPYRSMEIYSQCVTRTSTTKGLVTITATPEQGLTELVDTFMKDASGYLYFQNATWDDAVHLDEETKNELLASIPKWQHDMRARGIPMMGEGLIYDIDEREIIMDPIAIPDHWRRVCGMDIGITHPTAAVWTAYDAATDIMYVYDCYHLTDTVPSVHALAINKRGSWIPVVLPHDADNTERGSGRTVADYYREAGVNAQVDTFYNPMGASGGRNNYVEPGIMELLQRMKTGRLRVFSTCSRIFEEMRRYHRKDGKIVKKFDDVLDAMRYSCLSVQIRGISEGEGAFGFNSAYADNWDGYDVNY